MNHSCKDKGICLQFLKTLSFLYPTAMPQLPATTYTGMLIELKILHKFAVTV